MGSTADTPSEAIAEMQSGAPALEDELDSPAAMNLGMTVMGTTCDASAEDRAYCDGMSVVECDDGAWKSIACPSPQYCGELDGGNVGCYSATSNDPDPDPDPVAEDAAMVGNDAGMSTMCEDVSGTYMVRETSPTSCTTVDTIAVTQSGCMVTVAFPDGSVTFTMEPSGHAMDVGDYQAMFDLSAGVVLRFGPPSTACTIMASR